jgi:predicted TIM-barrel fold metal-dependent hydrolase
VIIDSHCHAWERWPYQPPVPDDEQRGRVEQLLHEMDAHGVAQALVVSAQIDRNPANNRYVAEQVARYPDRLHQVVDLDSVWSPTYHAPGAADRLARMVADWPIAGFTHYLANDDAGEWLHSAEGEKLFRLAAEHNLIASISSQPHHQPAIREIALRFPSVPILCHHLSHVRADEGEPHAGLKEVLASASVPNIYLKVSGFAYSSRFDWDFPYADTMWLVRTIYEHFGPDRLCWGSDYPVVRFFMTYRQSLEVVRAHCDFMPEADRARILGGTIAGLLARRPA